MNAGAGIVLVGGGLAAQRCAETVRREGYDGRLVMLAAEEEYPYDRPPLSKSMLSAQALPPVPAFREPGWYEDQGIELRRGVRATGLDPREGVVNVAGEAAVPYEQLLIATGSRPRRLDLLAGFANVRELRTLADSLELRGALHGSDGPLVVIGAGFIGLEVAASARSLGVPVTIIEALPVPLGRLLGSDVGNWLADAHREAGVRVLTSAQIARTRASGERIEALELEDGACIECGTLVVGVGVAPEAGWVAGSGLSPDGIRTDPCGRTALPGVFAVGDVARPFDPRLQTHSRCEHWEAAAQQGTAAGRTMLGKDVPPAPLAGFWSDQYGMRIQYVGHAEHADSCEVEPDPEQGSLRVTYRSSGRVIAALVVNSPRDFVALRREVDGLTDQSSQPLEGALT